MVMLFLLKGERVDGEKEEKAGRVGSVRHPFIALNAHNTHTYMCTHHQLGLLRRDGLALGADGEGLQQLQLPVLDLEVEAQPVAFVCA